MSNILNRFAIADVKFKSKYLKRKNKHGDVLQT